MGRVRAGRGKTHLASAIVHRAIQNGFDALFVTAAEMIDDLSTAFGEGCASLAASAIGAEDRDRFYTKNFDEFMGLEDTAVA